MQTGVLRVLRATAASWWRHKELRRTGQTGQAQRLERETVLRDLGYLKQAVSLSNAHVTCGEGGRVPQSVGQLNYRIDAGKDFGCRPFLKSIS